MKTISTLLAVIVLSVVVLPLLFGQNTPASLPRSINISAAAPASSLSINANGDVQVGTHNTLDMFELASQNAAYAENLDSNSGNFKYHSSGPANAIQMVAAGIFFRTFVSGNAGNAAVPLTAFSITNGAPNNSMTLDATGNLTLPALKSTTLTRYVCVDTAGKLVSSATACSGT